MAAKKDKSLRGEALKNFLLKNADNKTEEFVTSINNLSEDTHMDLHALNYGFDGISEMDSLVIRADILIERSLRQLAAAIAENPIPEDMGFAAIKSFIRLMEPLDQPYINAVKELGKARNIIAHEINGDYTKHIDALIKHIAPGVDLETNTFGFQAATTVLIATISNRRGDIKELKGKPEYRKPT